MTTTLHQRRHAEINAKLHSLEAELEHWKSLTEEENRGLRRYHSQVRRLAAVFAGLTESVKQAIGALPDGANDAVLENAELWENQILAAHSIWEVFRSKLVLREDELFRDVLAACDDLAWECYGPAMQQFAPDRKGPPLVYFTATWSPFALSRDSSRSYAAFLTRSSAGNETCWPLRMRRCFNFRHDTPCSSRSRSTTR